MMTSELHTLHTPDSMTLLEPLLVSPMRTVCVNTHYLTTIQQGSREPVAMETVVSANLLSHERRTLVDGSEVYGTWRRSTHTPKYSLHIIFDRLQASKI